MEKHRLFHADLFWVLVSLSLSFIILLLIFQSNMFSGSFEMIYGDSTLHFPRLYTSILFILLTCFLVFSTKNRNQEYSTRLGGTIARVTGLGFIGLAAILNLVMILFTLSIATYEQTRFGEILMPSMPSVLVVAVLTLCKIIVLVLLFRNVSGKNRTLA